MKLGTRIIVASCSGLDSGKHGVVTTEHPVDSDFPFIGGRTPESMKWTRIKLDDGIITAMPDNRLSKE